MRSVASILLIAGLALATTVPPVAASPQAVAQSPRPQMRAFTVPPARWDAPGWSLAALSALRSHADALPRSVPADIDAWCPGYSSGDRAQREAFWVGLVSALAWHESTHRPGAVGGGGRWFGLVQIAPATARGYGCRARDGTALKRPGANLSCALRIMARTVPRDGVVSRGMAGVAADWGPFHSARKREEMRDWMRGQPYCQAPIPGARPKTRG